MLYPLSYEGVMGSPLRDVSGVYLAGICGMSAMWAALAAGRCGSDGSGGDTGWVRAAPVVQ